MSVHVQPALRAPVRRLERFDAALVSVALTALAVLWASSSAHGTSATIGAVAAGAATTSAMVSAQVRVGLTFHDDGKFAPVGLLLVAVPVWFAAAVLAALGMALTVPLAIATGALLTGALTRRVTPATVATSNERGPVSSELPPHCAGAVEHLGNDPSQG